MMDKVPTDATNWEMKAQPVRMSWIWKIKTSQAVMDLRNYDIIDGNWEPRLHGEEPSTSNWAQHIKWL